MANEKLTLLNAGILTAYGVFEFKPVSLAEAKRIVATAETVQSAIGHASTAEILSELLDFRVAVNRMEYVQQVGEAALIFKLKKRPPEGAILNRREIEEIGYEFGILRRLE